MGAIGFFNNSNKKVMKNAFKINKLDNQYKRNKNLLENCSSLEEYSALLDEEYKICEEMRKFSEEINLFIGIDASEKMLEELEQKKEEWRQNMMTRMKEDEA